MDIIVDSPSSSGHYEHKWVNVCNFVIRNWLIISPVLQLLQKNDSEITRMIKVEYTGEILNELKAYGINAY